MEGIAGASILCSNASATHRFYIAASRSFEVKRLAQGRFNLSAISTSRRSASDRDGLSG